MEQSLISMTGYGRAQSTIQDWQVRVALRSVNHRGLQVRVTTPDGLRWLEPKIKEIIEGKVVRGRVEARLELEPALTEEGPEFRHIDAEQFGAVARELNQLAIDHRLATPVNVEAVLAYRDYFERSPALNLDEDQAEAILPVVDAALAELVASRRREGQGIAADLRNHLEALSQRLEAVEALREEGQQELRTRAEQRLRESLREFQVEQVDENRLIQEIAYYVEKGDISEELQRARSHVEKLATLVAGKKGPGVGKTIDFYLQEMIRETNTLGSKSQHAQLTDRVIEMKALVEKMREQAANVE